MANEITGASLQPIYQRLNSAPQYHPLDADTFADWSMEAGDIVTISRDGNNYQSPVHNSVVTWKKGQQVTVSSTGKEKRDSVAKMSQRKYSGRGGGSAGLRNSQYQHLYVEDQYHQMVSGLELTGSSARLYVDDKYRQMSSGLALTSSSAAVYVRDKYREMQSGLALTSSAAAMYVQSKTTKAELLLSITNGKSNAKLTADTIDINGLVNELIAYDVSVESLTAHQVVSDGESTFDSIDVESLNVTGDWPQILTDASVRNNVLTLTYNDGTEVTFSKATSLSDEWSGNVYTVTAKQNGTTVGTKSVTTNARVEGQGGQTAFSAYVSTYTGTNWVNHDTKKLWLVRNGNTVYAKDENSTTSGSIFASVTVPQTSYTQKTLYCSSVEPTYPGSSTKYYYFRLEGNYPTFSAGSNYYMYRPSW